MEDLRNATLWNWWILGAILMIIETLSPGSLFIWLGFAALLTGVLVRLFPEIEPGYAILLFAGFSLISVYLGKWMLKKKKLISKDQGEINLRGERYIGKTVILTAPILQGKGRIALDGTLWQVIGEDLPEGTKVEIVEVEGCLLKVKKIKG